MSPAQDDNTDMCCRVCFPALAWYILFTRMDDIFLVHSDQEADWAPEGWSNIFESLSRIRTWETISIFPENLTGEKGPRRHDSC